MVTWTWGSSCPPIFMMVNHKSVGFFFLSLSSACPRFNMWIKEGNEEWVSWQCPPLTTLMTVALKWSASLGLFMETLPQLGGSLWEHSHLNCYVSRGERIGISKVNGEVGKLGKREQLLSGFPVYWHCFVCFRWFVFIPVVTGRCRFKHQYKDNHNWVQAPWGL